MKQQAKGRPVRLANVGSIGTASLLSAFNNIEMFLAPLAICSCDYAKHCKTRAKETFTILDSGSLELVLGTSYIEIRDSEFLDLAMSLGAHEVVCADVPNDPAFSFLRTVEFIEMWQQLPVKERPQIMVVPHGRSLREWFSNAEKLIKKVDRCSVGIPRVFAQRCGENNLEFRVDLATRIAESYPSVSVHLLGAGPEFLSELRLLGDHSSLRSADSTFLHRYSSVMADPNEIYIEPLPLADPAIPDGYKERLSVINRKINSALRAL